LGLDKKFPFKTRIVTELSVSRYHSLFCTRLPHETWI